MASQRHKREHNFFFKDYGGTQVGETEGPRDPKDASENLASEYDEVPAWPDADRPAEIT